MRSGVSQSESGGMSADTSVRTARRQQDEQSVVGWVLSLSIFGL